MEVCIKFTIEYKTKVYNTIRNMHILRIIKLIRKEDRWASSKKYITLYMVRFKDSPNFLNHSENLIKSSCNFMQSSIEWTRA